MNATIAPAQFAGLTLNTPLTGEFGIVYSVIAFQVAPGQYAVAGFGLIPAEHIDAAQPMTWEELAPAHREAYADFATRAIRHTYPNGKHVGDGFIHSGTFSDTVAKFTPAEAETLAQSMRDANPGHTFSIVAHPGS